VHIVVEEDDQVGDNVEDWRVLEYNIYADIYSKRTMVHRVA